MQLNVCKGVYVSLNNIDFICAATESRPLKRVIEGRERDETLYKFCNGRAVKSYIFLKSGRVLCSDVTPDTLKKRIEKKMMEKGEAT